MPSNDQPETLETIGFDGHPDQTNDPHDPDLLEWEDSDPDEDVEPLPESDDPVKPDLALDQEPILDDEGNR